MSNEKKNISIGAFLVLGMVIAAFSPLIIQVTMRENIDSQPPDQEILVYDYDPNEATDLQGSPPENNFEDPSNYDFDEKRDKNAFGEYDLSSKESMGTRAGEMTDFSLWLEEGWNLISIPLNLSDTSLSSVLQSIDGDYDAVRVYDAADNEDPWKDYHILKTQSLSEILDIDESIGFWVHVTKAGGTTLSISERRITSNEYISIHKGWNLVGYPCLQKLNRTMGLCNLNFGEGIKSIMSYDSQTGSWNVMDSGASFEPGKGYWFYSDMDLTWTAPVEIYPEPDSMQSEDIGSWWDEIVDIAVYKWGISDPYFMASIVKKESWFRPDCFNAPEKEAYESGQNPWHGEYYGKGLMQITGPWIAGVPYPSTVDWIYNMPSTAIHAEAPELTDAYNGSQNLNRGCWYFKALLEYYNYDQYKVATAYRWGWQPVDAGSYNCYDNEYVNEVFQFKQEYLDNVGIPAEDFPNM